MEAGQSEGDKTVPGSTHVGRHSWEQPGQNMLMDREDNILEFLIHSRHLQTGTRKARREEGIY